MADSGARISNGAVAFASVYRSIVDAELARPPQARVEAWSRRVGNTLRIYARVANLADDTLSVAANEAAVHALVWENVQVGVTGRAVRAALRIAVFQPLAPGASAGFVLDTDPLDLESWDAVHAVAVVDFRPLGHTGGWDMLQAALAAPAALLATPAALELTVVPGQPASAVATVALAGPHVVTWTAAADVPWLEVTPAGALPGEATVAVRVADLPPGPQTGTLTFAGTSEDGLALTCSVPVRAALAAQPPAGHQVRRRLTRPGS
ncbi:MAG: hypothetical protein HY825_09720 [Acidobacteria bacterium]|nr:hypothetical protein [Acidobacteriota bacterium]